MKRPVWRLEHRVDALPEPWPQLPDLAHHLPHGSWTLVGGLMVQAHVLHAGLTVARPTEDIDVVLHVETGAISWSTARAGLRRLGYRLVEPNDRRDPAHRFIRSEDGRIIDVLIADHTGPRAIADRVGHQAVVEAPGGTSALRKTVNLHLSAETSDEVTISIPDALGALTLKGGAYRVDSRDRDRHLLDGAMLAATVEDADALLESPELWTGSDARRIRNLARALPDDHPAWSYVPADRRRRAQVSLALLAAGPPLSR
ncbi:hypothetical protein [Pseudactinotalea sp. HY160]|uniref:hypothetical protein n=1 Tax=Pseudactinotalea sp. HY160 TaxID=2654490 RepID=UPI001883A643|nr:hypothetical protein [Pseudactinotalea sp. HY160]